MKHIVLETKRLILREYQPDDHKDLADILLDPIAMKYYPKPYQDKDVNRWIDWCINSYEMNGFGLWAIVLKSTGEFIGDCGLSLQKIDGQILPEIGYHLKRKHHHQGYGIEAATAVKNYVFSRFNFPALYSYMNKENAPSRNLAMRNGMSVIGEYADEDEMLNVCRITREEWIKANKEKKNVYLVGGPMGIGKTAVARHISESNKRILWIDGDDCWLPKFQNITEKEKQDTIRKITRRINDGLINQNVDTIVFSWVMNKESIITSILENIDMEKSLVRIISLIADETTLEKRLIKDIELGKRQSDVIGRSLNYLLDFEKINSIRIDTTDKTIDEIAEEVLAY